MSAAKRDSLCALLALALVVGLMVAAMFGGAHLRNDSGTCNGPHDSRWIPQTRVCVEHNTCQALAATSQCVEIGQTAQEDDSATVTAYNEARAHCAKVDIERDTDHVLRVYAKGCKP